MRHVLPTTILLLALLPGSGAAQTDQADEARIRNARSAAPASVADAATVVADGAVLHQGTNGWVCMPTNPLVANNAPMCLDAPWMAFLGALMGNEEPRFEGIGIGYMLQGDMPVSNKDPFATGPTADNEWVEDSGPHIMLIVSDASLLESLPTDPWNGGPWVMWKGTPYAHIMIPTAPRRD
jgi:hypothetical protein